jgi:hypothetical protein
MEEVMTDYLGFFWEHTRKRIRQKQGNSWASMHWLSVVIAVSTVCSSAVRETTMRAARAAGLPENITFVAAMEAAVIALTD